MRISIRLLICAVCCIHPAIAGDSHGAAVPSEIGNRAHGFSYQPTPSEVRPREAAAGLRLNGARREAANHILRQLDRSLLRDEGLSPASAPEFGSHD